MYESHQRIRVTVHVVLSKNEKPKDRSWFLFLKKEFYDDEEEFRRSMCVGKIVCVGRSKCLLILGSLAWNSVVEIQKYE